MRKFPAAICAVWCMGASLAAHAQQSENPSASEPVAIEEAIVRALNAAAGLRARNATVQAGKAGLRQARVRPNPELGLEVENFAGSGHFKGLDSTEFTFSARQRLERGGKRGARIALAGHEVDVARQEQAIARLDIIHAVQRAYIEAAATAASRDNALERAKTAGEIEAVARRRVENARDPLTALHRASAQAIEARIDAEQAKQNARLAVRRLGALWNTPDSDYRIDSTMLFALPEEIGVRQEPPLPAPDVAILEAAEARAAAAAALARAQARQDPTIGLGVRYLRAEEDVAGILSFSMPIPVFNANRGNIERANAERLSAELSVLDARREHDREHLAWQGALESAHREAIAVRDDLIPVALKALASAREGFEQGALTYLDVLEAQRLVSDLRDREIAALKRFHLARAAFDRLDARYREPFAGEELK